MSAAFQPLAVAVVTISDTRSLAEDRSGATLAERVEAAGHTLADRRVVTDDSPAIDGALRALISDATIAVILTTGGTGITERDVTPEAVHRLADKPIPGFGELFRWLSYQRIGAATVQSRATAAVCDGTLVFALPGSPGACRDAWDDILASQLDVRTQPCNFVSLLPRLAGAPASA